MRDIEPPYLVGFDDGTVLEIRKPKDLYGLLQLIFQEQAATQGRPCVAPPNLAAMCGSVELQESLRRPVQFYLAWKVDATRTPTEFGRLHAAKFARARVETYERIGNQIMDIVAGICSKNVGYRDIAGGPGGVEQNVIESVQQKLINAGQRLIQGGRKLIQGGNNPKDTNTTSDPKNTGAKFANGGNSSQQPSSAAAAPTEPPRSGMRRLLPGSNFG